jgi:hypothetical protein
MLEIEPRIYVSHESIIDTDSVTVAYWNETRGNVQRLYTKFDYKKALAFCRDRMKDGRYKNYSMIISKAC